jgi:type IV secretion system protein VirB10
VSGPERELTSGRRISWFQRSRFVLFGFAGIILAAIFAIVWFLSPSPPPPPQPNVHVASHPAYDPPAGPIIPAAVASPVFHPPVLAPVPVQVPKIPIVEKPAKLPEPVMYSYGSARELPEYLKPNKASAAGPKGSNIAYKPTTFAGDKTFTIPDMTYIMMPGPISCVMDTLIVTGATGESPFQCHLDQDVLSPKRVVLMEAGTKITGSYTSLVGEGQDRVVAVTAFGTTPNGVVVPLGGPIADPLGAAGVPGTVDNHWWQRIGGALILSLVDNAFALAQTELSKAGSTNINITSGSGGNLANQLLNKTINIPPTITLNQGTRVALWSTRFIDFSDSYKLEPVH